MNDTPGEDTGFLKNEDCSTPKAAGQDTIVLELSQTLKDEKIVTSFTVKAYCIVVGLNHKYDKKIIVSTIYNKDWNKTIKSFSDCARKKGINHNHVLMLTDVLDNNWQGIIESQQECEEERNIISRELKQKKKVVEEVNKLNLTTKILHLINGKPILFKNFGTSSKLFKKTCLRFGLVLSLNYQY